MLHVRSVHICFKHLCLLYFAYLSAGVAFLSMILLLKNCKFRSLYSLKCPRILCFENAVNSDTFHRGHHSGGFTDFPKDF